MLHHLELFQNILVIQRQRSSDNGLQSAGFDTTIIKFAANYALSRNEVDPSAKYSFLYSFIIDNVYCGLLSSSKYYQGHHIR